jgi:hypothetical protein
MTPEEAMQQKNWEDVSKNTDKYKKEFKSHKKAEIKLKIGQKVLLKNEHKTGKMDY